jgi:adenylate cyclase
MAKKQGLNMKTENRKTSTIFSKLKDKLLRPSNKYWRRIGEVLVKKGIITENQLIDALEAQKSESSQIGQIGNPARLGHIFVELGYASENEIVKAVNEHYKIGVSSLADNIEELVKKKRRTLLERLPAPRILIWLQLCIASTFIIFLVVLLLSYAVLNRQKEQLYQQTLKIGMVSLNYYANDARIPLLENDLLRLNTLIKKTKEVEGLLYAIIVNHKGSIIAHTNPDKIGTAFEDFKNKESVQRQGDVAYYNYSPSPGVQILNLTQPIRFKDKQLGEVHVGVSLDFIRQVTRRERSSIITMTFFIVMIGIAIAVLLGFWFSRPILKLVLAAQEISKGNYQYKVELARNDELGNLAVAFNNMSDELWMKSLMQDSFGKYVGPEVLEMIMNNPESAWLKGHRSEATIIFSDIRGFTAYSEEREPEEIVEKLNECLEIQTRAILEHGGYVDKFVGDGVFGVFGVPVYHKDHVERGVRAAIDMQVALRKAAKNGNELLSLIGIGINTGEVVSGNIGSQVKMEYTVVGDSVNIASRLNGFAGPGDVIISKEIYERLKGMIAVEALPPHEIKGRSEPMESFKVLGIKERFND